MGAMWRPVSAAWGPPQVTAQGAGVLCGGLSPGSAAGPTWVSVPQTARPCSQPCPEDGSIGWAGDRGTPGWWSPVPWGQRWGQPGLLCQHSTEDPLGTPLPCCCVLTLPGPSQPSLTAACPLQGDHQRGCGDRQGQQRARALQGESGNGGPGWGTARQGLTCCFCLQRAAAKGIMQVVVSRIAMAAPGMSECRAGGWGARRGSPPGPTASPSPASVSPRKKREGGPASPVVFVLIPLMELVSPSCHSHQSPEPPALLIPTHSLWGMLGAPAAVGPYKDASCTLWPWPLTPQPGIPLPSQDPCCAASPAGGTGARGAWTMLPR